MTVDGIAGSEGIAAMKVQIACFVLVSTVATISAPVQAADWGGGRESYKDVSVPAGIPVPAPVPVPDYRPSWYFRFDAGLGVVNEPDVSDDEFQIGSLDGPGPITGPADDFGTPSTWFGSDFDTFLTLGAGVGYYVGNGWRFDATIEKRSKDDVTIYGEQEYDTHVFFDTDTDPITPDEYTSDTDGNSVVDSRTRLTVDEAAKLDGTLWMANAYYDFNPARGFTPYIGGGIGFVWNEISRSRSQTTETCNNEAVECAAGANPGTYTTTSTVRESDKADKVTLAAAAMAGFSYDVSEMTAVDIGYRYLYLQGTSAVLSIGDQTSRLEIGDQHVHQVRAGLRFNVD